MKNYDYLKIKNKYEAVLFELMKEVSNILDYEDCNNLYKEWSLTLLSASIDFDGPKEDIIRDVQDFEMFVVTGISDLMVQIDTGRYNGKVIKQF